jgi:glutathione S-transferase
VTVNLVAREHRRPEFLRINPAGRLPVLVDGDLTLTESVAIVQYLAEKYPEGRLLPDDLADRARVHRWLLFAATELEQPLWRITRHTSLYPEARRLPAGIPVARDDFREMAAVADHELDGREFVVDDRVSITDLVLAYTLDWAGEARLLDEFPSLRAYMERLYARPKAPLRIAEAFRRIRG